LALGARVAMPGLRTYAEHWCPKGWVSPVRVRPRHVKSRPRQPRHRKAGQPVK
jgi:hypothetical protein